MTVPQVAIADISFTGGIVAFDWGTNGSFLLDLGFPWPDGTGARHWERALGAIVTPFQGSGGFYVERRNLSVPVLVTKPDGTALQATELAAGYAVQVGLGAAFGGGIFTAWVTIGLYATLEGDFYLAKSDNGRQDMVALRISGAFGVLFRGHAGLQWWIISIDVDITVGAEASTTLSWNPHGLALPDVPQTQGLILIFDFTVYASAQASACIRLGFVSLCRGISVSIPMRAQYQLHL